MFEEQIEEWRKVRSDAEMLQFERDHAEALKNLNKDESDLDMCHRPEYFKYEAAEAMIMYARPSGLAGICVQLRLHVSHLTQFSCCETDNDLILATNAFQSLEIFIQDTKEERAA